MLQRVMRPRVLIYTAILFVIVGAFAASLALRSPFRVDVVRDRASLARIVDEGYIENLYRLQVMNATESPQRYRVRAEGLTALVADGPQEFDVAPAEARWVTIALRVPPDTATQAGPGAHAIQFHIERLPDARDATSANATEKSTFVVPR
jgi:polyferredoxin